MCNHFKYVLQIKSVPWGALFLLFRIAVELSISGVSDNLNMQDLFLAETKEIQNSNMILIEVLVWQLHTAVIWARC